MIVYVNATGCTNACRHCGSSGRPPYGSFYSKDELSAIADEWGPIWPYFEVTAHPEFPEILDPRIIGPGNAAFPPTNGYGLAERDDFGAVIHRLVELGCKGISFTLHGLADRHDWFVCREGAFQTILKAGHRALEAGLRLHWNVFLDRLNLEQVPLLTELGKREFQASVSVELPAHRVSRRCWRYEKLRPKLKDVKRLFEEMELGELYGQPLEELTESALLQAWERQPDSERLRHPYEPHTWPPIAPHDNIIIYIDEDRKVHLDPMCGERILLGNLSDGRDEIMGRLQRVPMPPHCDVSPADAHSLGIDGDLLHPDVASIRLKAISAAVFGDYETFTS